MWDRIGANKLHFTRIQTPKTAADLSKPDLPPIRPNRLSQPLAEQLSTPLIWGRTRTWEPWPVSPPRIDRVDSWWPGTPWPDVEPKIVVQEQPAPPPVEVVWWRDMGGLLDMWI